MRRLNRLSVPYLSSVAASGLLGWLLTLTFLVSPTYGVADVPSPGPGCYPAGTEACDTGCRNVMGGASQFVFASGKRRCNDSPSNCYTINCVTRDYLTSQNCSGDYEPGAKTALHCGKSTN